MNEKVAMETKIAEWSGLIKKGLYGLLFLLILGAAFLAFQRWKNDRDERAFALLFEAEKMERDLAEEPTYATPGTPQFYEKVAAWDESKKTAYTDQLKKVLQTFPQSLAADLARLRLGTVYFNSKKLDEAKNTFSEVVEKGSSSIVKFQALEALASVYEDESNWDKASESHDKALALKNVEALKAVAELGKARVLKKQGKGDEARKILSEVIRDYPNTYYEKLARASSAVE